MKHVIILNGAPRAGKGTFAKVFKDIAGKGSIIDGVKQAAAALFGWDGVKDAKGRKLLSDLCDMSMGYDKGPFRATVGGVLLSSNDLNILGVRDVKIIQDFKTVFGMLGIKCTAVLIRRDDAEVDADKDGLSIDCNTHSGGYDIEVYNNGSIEGFEDLIRKRFKDWLPD